MSTLRTISGHFLAGWKVKILLALPIFAFTLWYGISHQFDDLWLFALAMVIASWEVASAAVHVVHKWQEWQTTRRRNFEADVIDEGDEGGRRAG